MNIYINKDNQALGPYTEVQISQMIESGSLTPQNLCSIDGDNWRPVSDFIETEEQNPFIKEKNLTSETKLKKDSPKKFPQEQKPKIKAFIKKALNQKYQQTKVHQVELARIRLLIQAKRKPLLFLRIWETKEVIF